MEARDEYDEAAERWARGMRNAQPFIQQRREAQRAVAAHNRANMERCGVKGCTRSGRGKGICDKHWSQVPPMERLQVNLDAINAQMRAASKARRRIVRQFNAGAYAS